jgi:predicted nucleic-acid-binding Zn-ribbon protein
MVHCPDCGQTLADESDVEFIEADAKLGFFVASKRFYHAACAHCGENLGGGVAAAQGNGGAAGADD